MAPDSPEKAEVPPDAEHLFPCPQCGADMRFDPTTGGMVCDYCDYKAPVDADAAPVEVIRELDFRAAIDAGLSSIDTEDVQSWSCPNCGARISMDEATHAAECPFCATPIVLDTGAHRQIKPGGVLPFALEERAARAAMTEWLGRLWFAPGGLQQYARKGRKMQGIYVPYWTYDADTKTRYTGQRGTAYYVTRTVMRNGKRTTIRERRIRWRPVSGRVARFFDDVLVLASRSLPKRYTDALEPWQLSALEPYRPEFLAGFMAEGYTVQLDEGFQEARAYMDQVIRRDIRFDIGGDEQRINSVNTTISDVTFKHVLLPIWTAVYKFRGKTYRFVVNGQTGKVQGERPWSVWKITLAIIAGLIIAGAIGYVIAQNQ